MSERLADLLTAARGAQPAWAARPISQRCRLVGGVRRGMADRADALGAMLVDAVPARRSAAEGLSGELLPLLSSASWLQRRGTRVLRSRRVGWWRRPVWLTGQSAVVERRPLGVVLVIAPGNYPLMLAGAQALQALAAGNAVLMKPAPGTVELMTAFAEALRDAGLPDGLFGVLGDTIEAGREAVASAVDHVVFTGSATTGRAILGELAERLTPATMELSGCDACVVLPNAEEKHLDRAATAIAFGLTYNGSQTCIAPRRVLATPAHAARLGELLTERLGPADEATPVSPAVAQRLSGLIDGAVADGARVLRGGGIDSSGRCQPTVLADVSPDSALVASDTFAPWVAVVPCVNEDAMAAADERCPYRLGVSIFGPEATARAMAARLGASNIAINDVIVPTADPRLPFGATGESGYGVTRGPEGLLAMTRPVVVAARRGGTPRHYDTDTLGLDRLLLAAIRLTHGRGRRLQAVREMVSALAQLGKPASPKDRRDSAPPPDDPPAGP
ncbi:MAG: aldehyde dehydrogenase family protein [Planctomycetota bacterium]